MCRSAPAIKLVNCRGDNLHCSIARRSANAITPVSSRSAARCGRCVTNATKQSVDTAMNLRDRAGLVGLRRHSLGGPLRYNRRPARVWRHLPWGRMPVWLQYTPWRVSCSRCGVKVERVPWADGSSVFTAGGWQVASTAARLSRGRAARRPRGRLVCRPGRAARWPGGGPGSARGGSRRQRPRWRHVGDTSATHRGYRHHSCCDTR